MTSVAFVTLGCPKNEVDTAAMKALVAASAYELSDDPATADIVVVNTCSFISTATEASIEAILDLAVERGDLPARDHAPVLLVTGCLVNRYSADTLAGELPEVSTFVSIEGEPDLLQVIAEQCGEPAVAKETDGGPAAAAAGAMAQAATPRQGTAGGPVAQGPDGQAGQASAYLMIADGCDRACSYCTIPAIRGPYRSRTPDELVAQARALVTSGVRELVLIAQDTTAYGHDLPGRPTLAALVDRLCEETDVSWLRLMYLQPEGVTDELISAVAEHPQVVHSFEMPLQHSSMRILWAMNRAGSRGRFTALVDVLRRRLPDIALRTTLITGFPGETDEEFADLLDFVQKIRFDYVGVFPFSPEEGTPAADLPDQIDEELRLARAQKLRDSADAIGWDSAAARIGQTIPVLVESFDSEEGCWLGRAPFQAPDIDGVVKIFPDGDMEGVDGADDTFSPHPGAIMRVRINDALLYDLEGTVDGKREG